MRRIALFAVIALAAFTARAADVRVLAAASLTDAVGDIARTYEQSSGDHIILNFGASSMLARQIQEGAPADLFLSADEEKMNALQKQGLIDGKSRVSILSNTLVVIVPAEGGQRLTSGTQLTEKRFATIALAEPGSVPAGIYARQYLLSIGIWGRVAAKVIPMDNVRAALAVVESGNADAGIVYRTDALTSKHVRIAFSVPKEHGPDISYPFAIVAATGSDGPTRKFLAYLTSSPALDVFRRYGFLLR